MPSLAIPWTVLPRTVARSEEHTSELQSRNDISYAVFCLKKKNLLLFVSNLNPGAGANLQSHVIYYPLSLKVVLVTYFFFFFNDTATTEIYTSLHTLSLHDALPISHRRGVEHLQPRAHRLEPRARVGIERN